MHYCSKWSQKCVREFCIFQLEKISFRLHPPKNDIKLNFISSVIYQAIRYGVRYKSFISQ